MVTVHARYSSSISPFSFFFGEPNYPFRFDISLIICRNVLTGTADLAAAVADTAETFAIAAKASLMTSMKSSFEGPS